MGAAASCPACAADLPPGARFCHVCGTRQAEQREPSEFKQVTVLFADVVRSMDLAAALEPERYLEVVTELVNRSAVVVQRNGGMFDKFTGDGIMALFGAPVALEDHALRACRAALGIQEEAERLAQEVASRDGVTLRLRVGLDSGQVIAGGIGSLPLTYTAVGRHVGMAQRMESVAPPGGVMITEATARLVEDATELGPTEFVHIKHSDAQVAALRLLAVNQPRTDVGRTETILVGRDWQLAAVQGLLEQAMEGHGSLLEVVGSPGVGKSRLVREAAAMAHDRGVEVFWGFCESHASEVPFHVVTDLMRAAFRISELDDEAAREQIRSRVHDADEQDLLLLDDLLGIRDPHVALPKIDPDARRRRLKALVNSASLARDKPAVYIIEDVHWIDEVSESMLVDFIMVAPQASALVLITYRPEYHGALAQITGAQKIALTPLNESEISALIDDLLGPHPSVRALAGRIAASAAGNPFFAREIVRDLAERAVLRGVSGAYVCDENPAEISVPPTLQATIGARIDRLAPAAKQTLSAAAVIGLRFSPDLLTSIGVSPKLDDLVGAELIELMTLTAREEYVFAHPLIRTVAYESQLKANLTELHRRLAAALEQRDPTSAEANAALIAEHLEAAGELRDAYNWHLRAGAWSMNRDIAAARLSWERASHVADGLPAHDQDRIKLQIAPRTLLCGTAWRVHACIAGSRFEELRQLCVLADDKAALAVGMAGLVVEHMNCGHLREASQVASEDMALVESIGDPALTIGLSFAAIQVKVETDELGDVLRWAERVIELADGDATKGNLLIGSPLALAFATRGFARWGLGHPGWRQDFDQATETARGVDPLSHAIVIAYKYVSAIPTGVLLPDRAALDEIEEALRVIEQTGDDYVLAWVRLALGLALVHSDGPDRGRGLALLEQVKDMCRQGLYTLTELPIANLYAAREQARSGDRDGALPLIRAAIEDLFIAGQPGWSRPATRVLVETLLESADEHAVQEAKAAAARLAATPAEGGGTAMRETVLLLLSTLLARADGDEAVYRGLLDQYRTTAESYGYEGHLAMADALT